MRSTQFLSRLKDFSLSLKPILKIAPVNASAGEPNLVSSRFNLFAQQRRSLRLGRFVCFSVRVVFHILVSSSADSAVEKQPAHGCSSDCGDAVLTSPLSGPFTDTAFFIGTSSVIPIMCLHGDKRETRPKPPTLKKKG